MGQKLEPSGNGSVLGGQVEIKGGGNWVVGLGVVDDEIAAVWACIQ